MKNILLIITLCFVSLSCSRTDLIPRSELAAIYADMYLLDQFIARKHPLRKAADTLAVYEPIFNRYGYTFEDYDKSVNKYLKDPERFIKIYEEVEEILNNRVKELDIMIEKKRWIAERWPVLDNIRIKGADTTLNNSYSRALNILFFKPAPPKIRDQYVLIDSTIIPAYSPIPENVYSFYSMLPSQANEKFSMVKKDDAKKDTTVYAAQPEKKGILKLDVPNF